MTDFHAIDENHLREWIGRAEEAADRITPRLAAGFLATLDETPAGVRTGAAAPLGIHWCLAPSIAPMAALGPDGHPARGGFLPPVPLPRRMWAGGRIEFLRPFTVGDEVTRRSVISDVAFKEGRSGSLCFVAVMHEFATPAGIAVRERQDIVYRGGAAVSAEAGTSPAPMPAAWQKTVFADPVLLFRYSALTFNGHRIHYDRAYCLEEEGYPGLVVHGPLQATFLMGFAASIHDGRTPEIFEYRALRPLFDGADFTLNAAEDGPNLALWTMDAEGRTTMKAEAVWA